MAVYEAVASLSLEDMERLRTSWTREGQGGGGEGKEDRAGEEQVSSLKMKTKRFFDKIPKSPKSLRKSDTAKGDGGGGGGVSKKAPDGGGGGGAAAGGRIGPTKKGVGGLASGIGSLEDIRRMVKDFGRRGSLKELGRKGSLKNVIRSSSKEDVGRRSTSKEDTERRKRSLSKEDIVGRSVKKEEEETVEELRVKVKERAKSIDNGIDSMIAESVRAKKKDKERKEDEGEVDGEEEEGKGSTPKKKKSNEDGDVWKLLKKKRNSVDNNNGESASKDLLGPTESMRGRRERTKSEGEGGRGGGGGGGGGDGGGRTKEKCHKKHDSKSLREKEKENEECPNVGVTRKFPQRKEGATTLLLEFQEGDLFVILPETAPTSSSSSSSSATASSSTTLSSSSSSSSPWVAVRRLEREGVGYVPRCYLKVADGARTEHLGDEKSSREAQLKALADLHSAASFHPHPEVVYGAMIPEPDYSDEETSETKNTSYKSNLVSRNNRANAISNNKDQKEQPQKDPLKEVNNKSPMHSRLDDKGLIMPKKLINPCLESSDKKNLHRELLFNQKMGLNVLNQKSELQKAMEKHKDKQVLKEQEKERQQQLTPFQKVLEERAQKLETLEKDEKMGPQSEGNPSTEFHKIHAKVRAKMEAQ